jgi:hypothetical protein
MRVVGYCLMPNHFHVVLWPAQDDALGRWMQWLLTAHVHGYHKRYGGSGHVWQGRFRAFPIAEDKSIDLKDVQEPPSDSGPGRSVEKHSGDDKHSSQSPRGIPEHDRPLGNAQSPCEQTESTVKREDSNHRQRKGKKGMNANIVNL